MDFNWADFCIHMQLIIRTLNSDQSRIFWNATSVSSGGVSVSNIEKCWVHTETYVIIETNSV